MTAAAHSAQGATLLQDKQNGFGFARSNPRPVKPRSKGVTEIRGPYYTVCRIKEMTGFHTHIELGYGEALPSRRTRNVRALLAANTRFEFCLTRCCRMGTHVDGLKFAGGQPQRPNLRRDAQC